MKQRLPGVLNGSAGATALPERQQLWDPLLGDTSQIRQERKEGMQ